VRVLVSAASHHDATHEIAEARGAGLARCAVDSGARPLEQIASLDAFDTVVLGSSIYMGRWLKSAREFGSEHAAELSSMPAYCCAPDHSDRRIVTCHRASRQTPIGSSSLLAGTRSGYSRVGSSESRSGSPSATFSAAQRPSCEGQRPGGAWSRPVIQYGDVDADHLARAGFSVPVRMRRVGPLSARLVQ
jgi:hypothetical protein